MDVWDMAGAPPPRTLGGAPPVRPPRRSFTPTLRSRCWSALPAPGPAGRRFGWSPRSADRGLGRIRCSALRV